MRWKSKYQTGVDIDDRFYPICPMLLYFKGDEDKCNPGYCDYDADSKSCTKACERK